MSRRRFVVRQDEAGKPVLVEVGEEWEPTPGANTKNAPVTDLYMDGARAPDGTDIGSRNKRRAYMQANGVADASDYTNHWAKAERERAMGASHPREVQQRKADLIETMRRLEARRH